MLESLPGSPEGLRRSIGALPGAGAAPAAHPWPPPQGQPHRTGQYDAATWGDWSQEQQQQARGAWSLSPDLPRGSGGPGGWRDAGGDPWRGQGASGLAASKAAKSTVAAGDRRSSSASPPRRRHGLAASDTLERGKGAAAPAAGLVDTRLSGRHSPEFRQGMAAAAAARLPHHADDGRDDALVGRPHSASPSARSTLRGAAAAVGAEATWRARSRSCSPTLGGGRASAQLRAASRFEGYQQQQQQQPWGGAATAESRRSSPEGFVLAPRCGTQQEAADATSSGAGVTATGQGRVLTALLPLGAAEERQRRDLAEYVAFTWRMGLFKLWREHAQAAQGIG